MEARMNVWALEITKIQTQENSKKQLPPETAKYVFLDTGGGVLEVIFFIKNHNYPRNRPYGAPGLQNDRPGLKKDRPGLKNNRKFDHFADKNQDSCSQASKEIRASQGNKEIKLTKKWHGGGICAQRTGYIYISRFG
jgi:hypothetical protein